ncbi:hypothetical protein L6452_39274 [Arctium lappa]|uniref:Uncharacterized protein n=1 Tax=Arctium lappa TaxID=4217 RepID=A0ACB8XVY9_ARCLA|nr:hypothetical protein L6452_39274 [Arctium lappa]
MQTQNFIHQILDSLIKVGHLATMESDDGDQNQTSPTEPREPSLPTAEEIDVAVIDEMRFTDSIPTLVASDDGNIGFHFKREYDEDKFLSNNLFPQVHQRPLFHLKSLFSSYFSTIWVLYDIIRVSKICCIYLGAGTLCFYLVRHQISGKKSNGVLDALYFTVVLLTSVGYGDLTPDSTLSLLLATLFGIVGVLLTGALLSLIAGIYLATPQGGLLKTFFPANHQNVESYVKSEKVIVLGVFLVIHMAVGIPVLVSIGDLDFIHAFYCINATIISVGSDNCFSNKGGRVFALLWIVDGMVILSFVLFTLMEMYTQRRQISLVKKALKRKPTLMDLKAADLDGDGVVGPAEYILYKLREMGKLSRQEMEPITEEYQRLGVYDMGISGAHDLTAMESNGGNQASPTRVPIMPSFRIDQLRSVDKERKFSEYFPWFQNSHDLWKIIIILSIYFGAGTVCFYLTRHHISGKKTNNVLDALFFTLVITTSVGYEDLSPDGTLAILLASLFALLGVFLIGVVLSIAAELLVKQRELLHKVVSNKHLTVADANSRKRRESKKVKNKFMIIVVLFLIHMVVGTAILVSVEDLDFIRAFYCISSTITSASSGMCFSTKSGRVLALFWILLGTIYKGHVLFTFMEIYPESKRIWVVKTDTTTPQDLVAADLDGDGVVVLAEYILYKLLYTKKLCQEDVAPIFQEFRRLVDVTGRLSLREIISSYS